jgi:hypothetical protein
MTRADRRLGAALVLMALGWLWLVQTEIPGSDAGWPGPRGFPVLLGIVLAALGAWMTAFPGRRPVDPGFKAPDAESRRSAAVAAGTFGLLVLDAFLLERAGFLVATIGIITLAMTVVLRMRRWVFIAGFAVMFSLGCWVIFNALLGIPLPRGSWIAW